MPTVMRRAVACCGLLTLALSSVGCGAPEVGVPKPRRIVLFSMDTVRADRVAGYGSTHATPALARLAEEGVVFSDFYAASSYTLPAHMSLFTGLDPVEHGVDVRGARLAPDVPTLAERLREAGYRTQAFHEGVYVAGRFGFDRGFDAYVKLDRLALTSDVLPDALTWMRETSDPYFLFLHTYTAHYPYGGYERYRREHPERGLLARDDLIREVRRHQSRGRGPLPPALREACTLYNQLADGHQTTLGCGSNRLPPDFPGSPHFRDDLAAIERSYAERIRRVDAAIARVRGVLEELDQWRDTLFIVTSDHGEAFFEHGQYRHDYVPFDEVLKAPLLISYPRLLASGAGRRIEGLAWHVDLAPTILRLAGVAAPELEGVDLTPALRGESELPDDRAIYPAVLRPIHKPAAPARRVVLRGGLKYIEGDPRFGDADGLLFDLRGDPGETRNLRSERGVEAQELARLARERDDSLARRTPVDQVTGAPIEPERAPPMPSAEEQARLRALGYLD